MGQRLVVNIISNDEILACGYYHWSAYTVSAAKITHYIVSYAIENADKALNLSMYTRNSSNTEILSKLTAFLMLEDTGAGIYHADEDSKEINEYEKFDIAYNYKLGENRAAGLIALTPEKIKEFNSWGEGIVNIDISTDTVEFNVFDKSTEDEVNYEIKEGFVDEESIKELNFDFIDRFTFEQCDMWYDKIVEMCSDKSYPFFRHKTDPFYYRVIA